jgi:hypothetical protein
MRKSRFTEEQMVAILREADRTTVSFSRYCRTPATNPCASGPPRRDAKTGQPVNPEGPNTVPSGDAQQLLEEAPAARCAGQAATAKSRRSISTLDIAARRSLWKA